MKTIAFDALSIAAIRAGTKNMTRRPYIVRHLRDNIHWKVGDEAWVRTGWVDDAGKRHPAMFMKRADSPFSIRITAHRVERLQEITAEDVEREGVEIHNDYQYDFWWRWDSIYKHMPGKRWEDNPLVEVLTFTVIEEAT